MTTTPFDIFKEDTLGNALWIAAVGDPKTAQRRLNELVDQRTSRAAISQAWHVENLLTPRPETVDASLHPDIYSLRAAPCLRSAARSPAGPQGARKHRR